MSISGWDIVSMPREWYTRFEKQVWDDCVREGRASYRAGLPENHPTGQFRDPDMRVSWAMGWHQAMEVDRSGRGDLIRRMRRIKKERGL